MIYFNRFCKENFWCASDDKEWKYIGFSCYVNFSGCTNVHLKHILYSNNLSQDA